MTYSLPKQQETAEPGEGDELEKDLLMSWPEQSRYGNLRWDYKNEDLAVDGW